MGSNRQLILSIALSFVLVGVGTVGFMTIEGWNFLDSFYMTVITLSTVGFGEVHPVGKTGRLFTIGLIVTGVGFLGYVVGAVVQFMVEGRIRIILRRRMLDKKIDRLKEHYIICGYGRIGRVLCLNLRRKPLHLVVIEKNPDLIPTMDQDNVLYVTGEATREEFLLKAGIKRAKGLVAALATDIENVFLILTARQLNPALHIVARASMPDAKSKLKAAGADTVESPYEMGAVSMAQRIIRPSVTSFLDSAFTYKTSDIQMEEIPVAEKSPLVGVMLKDSQIRQKFNLIIIAIKKPDGTMRFNPSFEAQIHTGDTVIAVGEEENLQQLEKLLNP